MKITFLQLWCSALGTFQAGKTFDIPNEYANELIKEGHAIAVEPKVEVAAAPQPKVEQAVAPKPQPAPKPAPPKKDEPKEVVKAQSKKEGK